jgi:hypothetical protein
MTADQARRSEQQSSPRIPTAFYAAGLERRADRFRILLD